MTEQTTTYAQKATSGKAQTAFRAFARKVATHKLGDLLLSSGLVTQEQLDAALRTQKETGGQLGTILIQQSALTAVQLYRTLSQQWCLKAAAAGMAVVMHVSSPAPAQAASPNEGVTAEFTLAADSAAEHLARRYPELFGTRETRSNDITAFRKWTAVMDRFDSQMASGAKSDARVAAWMEKIESLRGLSPRQQIEGINAYLNKIEYIEDIDNYGKSDQWATPVEFLKRGGDCEDFAIAKYASLRALGFSADQLRVAIVKDKIKNEMHAILIVYSSDGNFVLDNQNKKVEAITAVSRYQPIFSINSTSWWKHSA